MTSFPWGEGGGGRAKPERKIEEKDEKKDEEAMEGLASLFG